MRICRKCGVEKDESEFYKSSHIKDGLATMCKACSREVNRIDRQKYEAKRRETKKQYAVGYREKHREELNTKAKQTYYDIRAFVESLKTPCVKCGETRKYVIDFHHIDPSRKKFNLNSSASHSKTKVSEEVAKCVCLCRNCHQEFHHFFGRQPEEPFESLCEYLGNVPSYTGGK